MSNYRGVYRSRYKKGYPGYNKSAPRSVPGYVLDAYALSPSGEYYRLHAKNGALYIWPQGYHNFSRKIHYNGHGPYIWWYGKIQQVKLRIRAWSRS